SPSAGTLTSALSGRPNVTAAVSGGSVLGLGSLGANYSASATGNRSYSASSTYNFSLASNSNLTLGLLGMTAYNGGFTSMNFSVVSGATTLISTSFTTLASAQTYFTDHPLSLGTFVAGANNLVISFSLTAAAAKGADIGYVLSSKPTGALATGAGVPAGGVAVATTSRGMVTESARRAPTLITRVDRLPAAPGGLGFKTGLMTLRPMLGGAALAGQPTLQAEERRAHVLPVSGAGLRGIDRR
ncbi:hypothetical protein, partial [Ideonella azotifigens]